MIKELSLEAIQKRYQHDSFIVMLNACVNNPERWDVVEILSRFYITAFNESITEQEIDNNIIDKIRKQLLVNSFGSWDRPLPENLWVRRVKSEIIFE